MKLIKSSIILSLLAGISALAVPVNAKAADTDFSFALRDDGSAEVVCINPQITKAEIPSEVNGRPVTALGENCFQYCTALTEVIIPDSITEFKDYAFFGCSSLTELEIPASVTIIGDYVFDTTENMTQFIVDENNPAYQSPDGVLYTKSGDTLIKYPESRPDSGYAVLDECRTLKDWCFIGSQNLESIDLKQVQTIGEDAFYYCVALKSIAIPEGVTDLNGAVFGYCSALEQISLPLTLQSLGERCFYACTALQSVRIPDNVQKLGAGTFCNCTNLQSIIVPKGLVTVNAYCMGYSYDEDSDTYKVQDNCTLYVFRDTPAWKYAVTNHIQYELLRDENKYLLPGVIAFGILDVILLIAVVNALKKRRQSS